MKILCHCLAVLVWVTKVEPSSSAFVHRQAPLQNRHYVTVPEGDGNDCATQDVADPLSTHPFWHKSRSSKAIESHVLNSLDRIHDECTQASVQVVSEDPPLVIIHDFLSKDSCEAIIQRSKDTQNLQRSTLGASQNVDESRTSSTVWLRDDQCEGPLRLLASKLSSISGLPASHMENLQVVRYRPGEEFCLHTDHQDTFNDLACRGRLATCLLYLSPCLGGGETWFPGVQKDNEELSISPTQGSAVFFWNTVEKPGVENYHPNMYLNTDMRMRHAGLPVTEGEKWVCNRWIHPIDFGAGVRGMK